MALAKIHISDTIFQSDQMLVHTARHCRKGKYLGHSSLEITIDINSLIEMNVKDASEITRDCSIMQPYLMSN